MSLSQKDAVFTAVSKVLESKGKTLDPTASISLSQEEREQVIASLLILFQNNRIDLSKKAQEKYSNSQKELYKYIRSLVSNWLSRDPRFNGRAEEADRKISVVHELRYIRSKLTDPNELKAIEQEISNHIQMDIIPANIIEDEV